MVNKHLKIPHDSRLRICEKRGETGLPERINKMMNDEVPAGIPDPLLVDWTPWVCRPRYHLSQESSSDL